MHEPIVRLHPVCLRRLAGIVNGRFCDSAPATLRPYLSSDLSAHDAGLEGAMTQLVKDFALFCCLVPSVSGIVITAATFLV
jgi:hypothetical protein